MHYLAEIDQNYHKFALFDPPHTNDPCHIKVKGSSMIPAICWTLTNPWKTRWDLWRERSQLLAVTFEQFPNQPGVNVFFKQWNLGAKNWLTFFFHRDVQHQIWWQIPLFTREVSSETGIYDLGLHTFYPANRRNHLKNPRFCNNQFG